MLLRQAPGLRIRKCGSVAGPGIKVRAKVARTRVPSPYPSKNGRIRTTSVRILIPGPATDPHLRIRSPVLALGARTTGLILHFLNGLFDMNFFT